MKYTSSQIAEDYEYAPNEAYDNIIKDLENAEILYHNYTEEEYEGSSLTLYKKENKYYHVDGSHCSCYGLEGQWKPVEMPLEAIIQIVENTYHFSDNENERKQLLEKLNNENRKNSKAKRSKGLD